LPRAQNIVADGMMHFQKIRTEVRFPDKLAVDEFCDDGAAPPGNADFGGEDEEVDIENVPIKSGESDRHRSLKFCWIQY
jgi:hypothetical protein